MANNEKIISKSVFEEAIKDILTELVNSTYSWESYSDEEVGQLVELDPTQVAELSAVINDSVSAKNKVYSSQYTKELLQENLIEANKYSEDLVANLSNIKWDIVDSLPDSSTVNKSTIYILKDSSGGTNNTLNVWSDTTSAFVEVGKLNVNMNNYYTKSEVDAELAKKANADEVLKPDAIVADLTTTSGSTTLSTAGLQTELDKKVDIDKILSTISGSPSDENLLSEKAIYEGIIKDRLGNLNIDYTYRNSDTMNVKLLHVGLYKFDAPTKGVPEGNPQDYVLINLPWRTSADGTSTMQFGVQILCTPSSSSNIWKRTVWDFDERADTYTEGDYTVFTKWE